MARRPTGERRVGIEGARELRDMLKDFAPNEVRNILRNTVNGLAARVRDELERNVKKTTGRLADSLKVHRRRGEPNHPVSDVRGGHDAPYMLMLEYGTSKTKAQPFIVPTVESFRPNQAQLYREEFWRKVEKAIAKRAGKRAKGRK